MGNGQLGKGVGSVPGVRRIGGTGVHRLLAAQGSREPHHSARSLLVIQYVALRVKRTVRSWQRDVATRRKHSGS